MNKKRLNEPWGDPFGKIFNSHADLCASYGISRKTLKNRLYHRWSLPEALNIIPRINHRTKNEHINDELTIVRNIKDDTNEPTEYYVVLYKKEELIFSYNGIIDHIRNILQRTKGYDETLFRKCPTIRDHLGHEYSSIKELCLTYNITRTAYESRMRAGWEIEKVLTTPTRPKTTEIIDHLGQKYPSKTALCDAYGLKLNAFLRRIKDGWDLEKALTTPADPLTYDHLGNAFTSYAQMCKHYNKSIATVYNRLYKQKLSLKEALTNPSTYECLDPFGNQFPSANEMARHYKIKPEQYKGRIQRKWSIIEALELIPRIDIRAKNLYISDYLTIIRNIKENNTPTNYYEVCLNGKITTMHHDAICEYCLKILRKEKQDANSKKNQDHASCGSSRQSIQLYE